MSKSIATVLMLGLVTLAACAQQQQEPAPVEPAPIIEEPVSGKF
ncbi:MAG: hypothetical protein AAFX00_01970 [Pseudomonadota bacterium]